MHEFSEGISTRGLLHPIILRLVDGKHVLVAGERRLRAITDLSDLGTQIRHDGQLVPLGHIPYTLFDDLDPLAAEEAELEENLHRENLTWQEKAAAVARIALLRKKQAAAAHAPAPTTADIAREIYPEATEKLSDGELGIYAATVREDLIVAKHLNNPAIAGAKSAKEAFKILKREEKTEKHRQLGEEVGRTFSADAHALLHADSLEWLTSAPAESFDVILTDPPYGMGADEFGDSGKLGGVVESHGYADDEESFTRILSTLQTELFRVAKAQAHLYWFCDIDKFHSIKSALSAAGWSVFRTPLIWLKRSGMRAPWPDQGPQRKYEIILYAVTGKRTTL
jgi:ParB-like chromosome segregation protein Spo0J